MTRFDSWLNVMTGLGSATRDKSTAFLPQMTLPLDVMTLQALFSDNPLAARIVTGLPDEAMREGFGLSSAAADLEPEQVQEQSEEIIAEVQRLGIVQKFVEAPSWGRLFGFGGVIVGIEGSGAPDTPLDEDTAGAPSWLMVVDRREMVPDSYYSDPTSDKFGEPEFYRVQVSAAQTSKPTAATFQALGPRVHESRIIRFGGVLTSRLDRIANEGCDYSVMQRVFTALQQADQNWASVCQLMTDMSQAVFAVEGLMNAIATGNEALMQKRVQMMDQTRSTARAIILDAAREKFERVATPMSGVNEVLEQSWKKLAAAAEMPLTVLMGVSPAGMNATGESDIRLWYDRIGRWRSLVLAPPLLRLIRLISRGLGHSKPESWQIAWPPLWQLSASEQADVRLKTAQSDHIEMQDGVVLPEEVALTRHGGKEWNGGKLQISVKERKTALKAALDEIVNPPPAPAPMPGQPPNGAPPPPPNGQRQQPARDPIHGTARDARAA